MASGCLQAGSGRQGSVPCLLSLPFLASPSVHPFPRYQSTYLETCTVGPGTSGVGRTGTLLLTRSPRNPGGRCCLPVTQAGTVSSGRTRQGDVQATRGRVSGKHRELWQDTAGWCASHQRESLRQAWGQWESTGVSGTGFETQRERGSWLNKGECRQDLRSSVPKVTWLALFRKPYGSGFRA